MWALTNLERVLAFLFAILLAPLFIAVAIIIVCVSRRTPLVAHLRVKQYGEPFWMLKFRTMWHKPASKSFLKVVEFIADEAGPLSKKIGDERVSSRLARLCRQFSIDELPQLIHVAAGDMALVGPRPLTRTELLTHYGPHAREVLGVKPGLTGLWQVMGRNSLTYRQRRRLDLFLVRSRSARLYAIILGRTFYQVFSGKGAW
jgi:lipopolysaccharide/colanic/teichoic acid biosynthesis glycosyltransferase